MRLVIFLILLAGFLSTSAGAQEWTKTSGGLNDISAVDETTAWGVNKNDEIYRTNDAGKTWQRVPGTLRQISAISYDAAWGVNGSKQIWRTNNGGKNWDNRPGRLKQVSAANFDVAWGVNDADEIFRTNDGGATWEKRPGGLSQISAVSFDSAWGVNASGQIWRTKNGGTSWDNRPGQLKWVSAATYDEAIGVNAQDAIYQTRDGGASWERVPGFLQRTSALSYNKAWGVNAANEIFVRDKKDAGAAAVAAASSGQVVQGEATITPNCPEGQAAATGGECVGEVYFYQQDYLSLNEARLIALENGNALATYPQVVAAYGKLALHVFAYARLSSGQFAVPIQRDVSSFKKGINLGVTGGNQGFLFVSGCPAGFAPGLAGACKNTRVTSAFADISKIEMRQSSGSTDTLTQISDRTWKDTNGRYYLETGRDGISIYLSDLQNSAGRKVVVDLYDNKVSGSEGNSGWTFDVVKASDGANRKDWVQPHHIAEVTSGVTRVGYGEYLPQRGDEWGAFQQTSTGGWVQVYDDPTVAQRQSFVSGISEVSRSRDKITLRDSGGKTFVIDLAAQTVSVQGGGSIFPANPGIAPKASAFVLWTDNAPLPTAEQARQNALIAQQEATASYYKLTSPLSPKDLNAVMVWIGEEASAATVDYCYKTTTTRPGYPWQAGDPLLPNYSGPMNRCEAKYGAGGCERNGAVIYPRCEEKQDGLSPICWQQCPKASDVLAIGQNTKVECGGIGCATNNDACAEAVKEMVFAPINMVLSIVTLGLDNAATKAAEGAAKAVTTGVTQQALSPSKWDDLWKAIDEINDLYDEVSSAVDTAQGLADAAGALAGELERWNLGQTVGADEEELFEGMRKWAKSYGDNFHELTSARIESIIDRKFPDPDDASYIKQQYGLYLLTAMTEADGWRIGREVASAVGIVDIIGVTSVINAYAQPVCRTKATPFPNVTIIPKGQRGEPDPLIWSD